MQASAAGEHACHQLQNSASSWKHPNIKHRLNETLWADDKEGLWHRLYHPSLGGTKAVTNQSSNMLSSPELSFHVASSKHAIRRTQQHALRYALSLFIWTIALFVLQSNQSPLVNLQRKQGVFRLLRIEKQKNIWYMQTIFVMCRLWWRSALRCCATLLHQWRLHNMLLLLRWVQTTQYVSAFLCYTTFCHTTLHHHHYMYAR